MKKLISILVAFAMMATLAVTSAFALDEKAVEGQTFVTKKLHVANDIAASELAGNVVVTFTFTGATGSAADNAASVTSPTVTIDTTDAKKVTTDAGDATTIYYFVSKALDAEFFGLESDAMKPGVYNYTVKETTNATTANRATEKKTGSDNITEKTFKLSVLKAKDGTLNFTASEVGEDGKITLINTTEDVNSVKTNGLSFDNNLFDVKETTDYDDSQFKMKKDVTDEYGIYNGEAFEFTYYLTIPDGAVPAEDVALVVSEDGTTETQLTGAEIYTNGTANTVNLKKGGYVYFKKLPLGSKVKASETDTKLTGAQDEGKMYYTTNRGMTEFLKLEADNSASAEVTNISNEDKTMEGVLHNSIPYIVLALVAIGGMAAYVVIRRRNADEA